MRFLLSLLVLSACSTIALAEQQNCDKLDGSKLTSCLNANIKDLNATISMLKTGFTLALSGQKSNNQCIGIQIDTATIPIMVPCGKNNPLETWTIAPGK
jgi:hypothetical protein